MLIDDEKSPIDPLDPPEFKGTIPEHMLSKMKEGDAYLFNRVSEMEEREKWLVQSTQENRRHLINIDSMARSVYRWRQTLTSRWGVIVGAVVLILPVIIKTLLEIWLKK